MRNLYGRASAAATAAMLVCAAARGQLVSDDVPRGRIVPEKTLIEQDLARSRLRLGPVRRIPSVAVTNAGYDNNVFATTEGPVGDWSFTIVAGLRFILPLGPKMYFRANVLPSYTWYDKVETRRGFGGTYGADLLGFFNHLSFEVGGASNEDFNLYSSEDPTRVLTTTRDAFGAVEVDLAQRFSVFARGEYQTVRYSNEGQLPGFDGTVNDRNEAAARGGVRYRITSQWDVAALVEQTWSDFTEDPQTRNNESRAYLLAVHYDRPQFYANLTGGYREGRARDGSTFPPYSTGTGSFFLSYFPIRVLEVQGYGRRRVAYSVSGGEPYYFEERIGGGLNIQVVRAVLLRGYAEVGPNKYPIPDPDGEFRRDDVTTYGGGLSIVIDRFVLTGLVTRSDYESNDPNQAPSYTRFTMGISFGGEFVR
jgi:hypothetical protein